MTVLFPFPSWHFWWLLFHIRMEKVTMNIEKTRTELWYLFTLINKLMQSSSIFSFQCWLPFANSFTRSFVCSVGLVGRSVGCIAFYMKRIFLKAIRIDKCNVHTEQRIQKVRSYIVSHHSMAIRHKYAEYVGLFFSNAPRFHINVSLLSTLPSVSFSFMDFAITMPLRKCGRLMQQQIWSAVELLAAIIQHIHHTVCTLSYWTRIENVVAYSCIRHRIFKMGSQQMWTQFLFDRICACNTFADFLLVKCALIRWNCVLKSPSSKPWIHNPLSHTLSRHACTAEPKTKGFNYLNLKERRIHFRPMVMRIQIHISLVYRDNKPCSGRSTQQKKTHTPRINA